MKETKFYTSGELAKMSGVTIRTIRYYDTKGILKPSYRNNSGHRLYSDNDFIKLKKILALKYLGLSLDDIMNIGLSNFKKNEMINSLKLQKNILQNKVNHMKTVLNAIEIAESSIENNDSLDWDKAIDIIEILEDEKKLLQQYLDTSNLNANVKLQDKFKSNEYGWYKWVFSKLNLKSGHKILEIGCGNGALWSKNIDKIIVDLDITLTDVYEEMIKDAQKNLIDNKEKFNFKVIDPYKIPYEDESFDIVIANHILFYMRDIDKVLFEIRRVLRKNGCFYCSTMDSNNMKELEELMLGFNSNINISQEKLCNKFGVENGKETLSKYFINIREWLYEDKLVVNDRNAILEYVYSIPGNILEILENRKKEFEFYVDKKIQKNGAILITNKSILFKSEKY